MIDNLFSLIIAFIIGLLIGLEREYSKVHAKKSSYAGIRTYPLISVLGFLSGHLSSRVPGIIISSLIIVGVMAIIAYYVISVREQRYIGATSEISSMITFILGLMCFFGETTLALIIGIVLAAMLYSKKFLHGFAKKVSSQELSGSLKFAIITFVILPLIPNQNYGPYEIFNPYVTWLMVVLISGIGFIGYVLMKNYGGKGVELAGILGGLVSSTAVTSSFAISSKKSSAYYPLALGVILANLIMFFRILIEVFVVNHELFFGLLARLLPLILVGVVGSWIVYRKAESYKSKLDIGTPFAFVPALTFAAIFAAVIALAKLGNLFFQDLGVYVVSLISGLADVDAITVSLSQLSKDNLESTVAIKGIMLAALSNICVKGGISFFLGSKEFRRPIIWIYLLMIILGLVTLLFS